MKKNGEYVGVDEKYIPEDERMAHILKYGYEEVYAVAKNMAKGNIDVNKPDSYYLTALDRQLQINSPESYNSISDVTSHKIQLSGTARKSFVTMIAFKPIASNIPITRSDLISCKIKFELDTNYKIVDLTNETYQNNNISEETGQTIESTTWRICNSNYIEIPASKYKYIMIE